MTTREQAAQLRAQGARTDGPSYRAQADRPSQRRSNAGSTTSTGTPARRAQIEMRGTGGPGDPLVFDGLASVTGQFYEMYDWAGPYVEQVHVGAFAETLAATPDVPLVLDHISSNRLARTGNAVSPLMLDEVVTGERTGLHVLAPSLQPDNPYVAQITPLLRSGLIDEMSFRFMITSGRWSDDWSEYHIHAVDIHRGDVAIVGYGANPLTAGAGLRSLDKATARAAVRADLRRIASRGLSGTDAKTVTALLVQLATADAMVDPIIDALCAADCALDEAQLTLSALLGLPNPDPEDMAAKAAATLQASRARAVLDLELA
jgi:HK97 family phage prohead protease